MAPRLAVCVLAALIHPNGIHAAEAPGALADIVRQVLARHPDMDVRRIQAASARTGVAGAQGKLDPAWSVQALAADDQTPSNFTFNPQISSRTLQIKGDIIKPLASGTTVSLNADYNRGLQTYLNGRNLFTRFNPSWRNQIDLTVRQPLLRGAGNPDYHETLRAALADAQAADMQRQVTARALARKALQLYFSIALDEADRKLAADSVHRAERLLRYQRRRERLGLIEQADRLQAEALLAQRKLGLANAEARLAEDVTALNRLMLRPPDAPIRVELAHPPDAPPPDLEDVMRTAQQRRPELRALDARLRAESARLAAARDARRMQMDLIGRIGSRALAGNAGDAARKGFSLADRFVSVEVELSDTAGHHAADAAIRKAELARAEVEAQRRQTLELIRDDAATMLTRIRTGLRRWRAARERARAERRKFEAELARYREGRSDTATLIQFEGDLNQAEEEALLRRITLLLDWRQLDWVRGVLLDRLDIRLAGANAPEPRT